MKLEKNFPEHLIEKMINGVMDSFNFDKVHDAMLAFDWKWYLGPEETGVPGVWRLTETAKRLLFDILMKYRYDGMCHTTSSGGFTASIDDNGVLSLQFVLEEKAAYPEDYERRACDEDE